MILLIDNYDSFVHNLARYFRRLGKETHVVRNDSINVAAIRKLQPQAIVLSPGPCTPAEAGCSLDIVREFGGVIPLLGVCLGHQSLGQAFGGDVRRAPELMHGKTSRINHTGKGLFRGLNAGFEATRYHSLIVERDTLPAALEVTATSDDGLIMGMQHRSYPSHGVQFHPESIASENGHALLQNFLNLTRDFHLKRAA